MFLFEGTHFVDTERRPPLEGFSLEVFLVVCQFHGYKMTRIKFLSSRQMKKKRRRVLTPSVLCGLVLGGD